MSTSGSDMIEGIMKAFAANANVAIRPAALEVIIISSVHQVFVDRRKQEAEVA